MRWFEAEAPIRQKTMIAFGSLVGLILFLGLISAVRGDWIMVGAAVLSAAIASALSYSFRKAICDPYVNTVVRMEQLAAGDLTSPIAYTEYKDCVGRMTRAMFIFRDTAEKQIAATVEQAEVVSTLRQALSQLKVGDLTGEISATFPPPTQS